MNASLVVAVIDDNRALRESLVRLVQTEGYRVIQYASADDFFAPGAPQQLACAIIDVRLPGLSGIQLQQHIKQHFPILALSFRRDTEKFRTDTVQAIKAGAVDFLEKPVHEERLFAAIARAVKQTQAGRLERDELVALRARYRLLTPREREVFALVTAGC